MNLKRCLTLARRLGNRQLPLWVVASVCGSVAGCGGPERPDPVEVFNTLCDHSLSEDADYVRDRISPALLAEGDGGEGKTGAEDLVKEVMGDLMRCRGISVEKTVDPDKVVVIVGGVRPPTVRRFHVDMVYDKKHGWQLASRLYDEAPPKPDKGTETHEPLSKDD